MKLSVQQKKLRNKNKMCKTDHLAMKKGMFHRYCRDTALLFEQANRDNPPIQMKTAIADLHRISHELFGRTFFTTRFNQVFINQPSMHTIADFNEALQRRLRMYGFTTHGELLYDPITCKLDFYYREIGAIPYNDDLIQVVDI